MTEIGRLSPENAQLAPHGIVVMNLFDPGYNTVLKAESHHLGLGEKILIIGDDTKIDVRRILIQLVDFISNCQALNSC